MEPSWLPADDLSHDDDGALSTGKGHITGFGQNFLCQIDCVKLALTLFH